MFFELKVSNNILFAATRDGMFRKSLKSTDTLWQRAGLDGREITDFIVYNTDELLASTKVAASSQDAEMIYVGTNHGVFVY